MLNNLSRRKFLALSAAAGAGMFQLSSIARAAAARDYSGLPIGMQSYTLRKFTMREAVRHVQALGLHHIEFFGAHYSPASTAEQIKEMKQLLGTADIAISAHGVNKFSKDHEANRKLFEFAKRAGFSNLTANPLPDAFDSLDKLCAEYSKYNIRICIHNHGPGALYDKLEDVQKAVKGRHKLIGACVDTGHVLRSDQDPVKWIRELGPRVFALHIKDVAERQKRTHDVVIGKAHLDLVAMFKALKKIGFPADGSLSLEYESNPENPIDDIKQCLDAAAAAIAKAAA